MNQTQTAPIPQEALDAFIEQWDGYWSECTEFGRSDWRAEVSANNTLLGYWQWAYAQMDEAGELLPLFGYIDVEGLGASVHPQEALVFRNLADAEHQFEKHAKQHFETGHTPLILRLFAGEPDGDEATCGYPDEPDYVFRADCNVFTSDIQILRAD